MKQRETLLLMPLTGYAEQIGVWLAALQDSRQRTFRVLKDIKPHWLDFAPADGGESIGTILYHLAAIEASWLYEEVIQMPLPPELDMLFPYDVRDREGKLTAVSETMQKHMERLERVRQDLLEKFLNITTEDFRKARSLAEYDVSPVYVIHHLMQHEAEHRSQIHMIGMQANMVLDGQGPKETL